MRFFKWNDLTSVQDSSNFEMPSCNSNALLVVFDAFKTRLSFLFFLQFLTYLHLAVQYIRWRSIVAPVSAQKAGGSYCLSSHSAKGLCVKRFSLSIALITENDNLIFERWCSHFITKSAIIAVQICMRTIRLDFVCVLYFWLLFKILSFLTASEFYLSLYSMRKSLRSSTLSIIKLAPAFSNSSLFP